MVPLTDLIFANGFEWLLVYKEALVQIKRLVSKTPLWRPISYTLEESIFLFTNTFKVGAGGWVGQGSTHETAIPASVHGEKFVITQLHYPVHELEHLAIVNIVEMIQPILYNTTFTIVTNNKSLSYFMKQTTMGKRLTK
jgi:hypothetical protein